MTSGQPFSRCLVGLWVLCFAGVGLAQEAIPNQLLSKPGGFSPADDAVIRKWVDPLAKQLVDGQSPERIAMARSKLLDPPRRPGVSMEFVQTYAGLVVAALNPGLASKNPLVRQNVLIVAARLPGGPIEPFVKGITDPHPAVRYWAAKGAALATANENLLPSDQKQATMMAAISKAMATETSGPVVEQMYLALSGLRLPQARNQLLEGLGLRARVYAKEGLNAQIRGELAALRRISKVLVTESARQQANRDQVIQLVTVAAKYLQVIRQAVASGMSDELKPVAYDMVGLIEQVLNWGLSVFDPTAQAGPLLVKPLRTGDGATFQLHVIDWVGSKDAPGLLTKSRIAIPGETLLLKAP